MTENTNNSLAASVRQADYDRYIAALFAPAERREALFALIAFNHELARIADVVSEPMLGEIRLQWWREAIEAIYAGTPVRKHEVTQPLAQAIAQFTIPRAPLDLMIDTRAFDLAGEPPSDMAALEAYAEGTAGALNEAMMAVLGSRKAEALAAARHAGTAWALIGLMRAAPMHAARGGCSCRRRCSAMRASRKATFSPATHGRRLPFRLSPQYQNARASGWYKPARRGDNSRDWKRRLCSSRAWAIRTFTGLRE
jgi:phytoene/squalene synthetase